VYCVRGEEGEGGGVGSAGGRGGRGVLCAGKVAMEL
jgi:hypothetical protein